jgi:hypothetical protein
MKNDCDRKKCDDTAVPCSFAQQVVYSLECDKKELQEELAKARDDSFYSGLLVALQVLHRFDSHVQAMEIVNSAGGIKTIQVHAKNSGTEVDKDTMRWLKTGQA